MWMNWTGERVRMRATKTKAKSKSSNHTLALIAHDGKKDQLVAFVRAHLSFFKNYDLIATANTGKLLQAAGLKVKCLLSGPQGGDAQVAAEVATGHCQAVLFLRDPLGMHPHDPDISMLMRICDVHNVPLATNPATAALILEELWRKKKKEIV
jgi:methylglyoxal synthase